MALPIGEGADHLAAVRRGLHDRGASIRSRPTRCWRSAPAAATRRPCFSPLVNEVYTIEIVEPLGHKAAKVLKRLQLRQRPRQGRRRLPGLARTRPVRQDHRHLLARKSAAGAGRATQGRRPDGDPRRRALSADAVPAEEGRRQAGDRGPAADAVRADDRQGRGSGARCCPTRAKPTIDNGGFEKTVGDPPRPSAGTISGS